MGEECGVSSLASCSLGQRSLGAVFEVASTSCCGHAANVRCIDQWLCHLAEDIPEFGHVFTGRGDKEVSDYNSRVAEGYL